MGRPLGCDVLTFADAYGDRLLAAIGALGVEEAVARHGIQPWKRLSWAGRDVVESAPGDEEGLCRDVLSGGRARSSEGEAQDGVVVRGEELAEAVLTLGSPRCHGVHVPSMSGRRPCVSPGQGLAQVWRRSASQVVMIRSTGTPSRAARSQP